MGIQLRHFIFLTLMIASTAQAVTTYQYTGNNYTSIEDGSVSGSFTTSMSITGDFTVDTSLATMGLTDISANILSYSFFTGRGNIMTESNSNINDFFVAVDGTGQITHWRINVIEPTPTGIGDQYSLAVTNNDGGGSAQDAGSLLECYVDITCYPAFRDRGLVDDQPGTWSVSTVPIPATALLFTSGILGLIGIARRKHS